MALSRRRVGFPAVRGANLVWWQLRFRGGRAADRYRFGLCTGCGGSEAALSSLWPGCDAGGRGADMSGLRGRASMRFGVAGRGSVAAAPTSFRSRGPRTVDAPFALRLRHGEKRGPAENPPSLRAKRRCAAYRLGVVHFRPSLQTICKVRSPACMRKSPFSRTHLPS